MARKTRRKQRQLHGLGGAFSTVPTPVWIGLGAVALFILFRKRKEISATAEIAVTAVAEKAAEVASKVKSTAIAALTAAEKAAIKAIVPDKGEQFVDLAFELAPKYGLNPVFVLAFLSVESGFKLSPVQTGDTIPRCVGRYPKDPEKKRALALPGVKIAPHSYVSNRTKKRVNCDAYTPTTTGWGLGPMQIDYMAHPDFYARPDHLSARAQMEYAITDVILPAIKEIKRVNPNVSATKLFEGVIAAYNAGPYGKDGAAQAVKRGDDLTRLTAADWYIPRVRQYMKQLSDIFGGDATNMFA